MSGGENEDEASTNVKKSEAETDRMADHIKIRLPTWNPAKPKLWFRECENIFEVAKVEKTAQ